MSFSWNQDERLDPLSDCDDLEDQAFNETLVTLDVTKVWFKAIHRGDRVVVGGYIWAIDEGCWLWGVTKIPFEERWNVLAGRFCVKNVCVPHVFYTDDRYVYGHPGTVLGKNKDMIHFQHGSCPEMKFLKELLWSVEIGSLPVYGRKVL